MSFHPRKVLTHLTIESIKHHLEAFNASLARDVDWTLTEKGLREQLESLLLGGGGRYAGQITALQRVHLMAGELGDRAMIASCGSDVDLRRALSACGNAHERALRLMDDHPDRFRQAEDIHHSDHGFGTRSWSGFVGLRDAWPDLTGEPLQLFEARVETAFRQYDGSGAHIVVQAFERGPVSIGRYGEGRVLQLAAYLEGLPTTSTEFDERGIVRRNVRPVVEVWLVYASETGVIDVVAKAGRPLREEVARAFVEELFESSEGVEPVRLREVSLAGLARPQGFPVEPEDGILDVRLTSLRLEPDGPTAKVTIEVGRSGHTIHEQSRIWFGSNDPLARGPTVRKARIAIKFAADNGRQRPRTLPVELTEPHGSNLRDRSDEERVVGEKYLKRWGLLREL